MTRDDAGARDDRTTSGGWGMVPRAMAIDNDLSLEALRIHVVLSSFCGRDRVATVSQGRLAEVLRTSRQTVQRWLDELEAAGWVISRQRIRKTGGWGVNEYLVAPFPQVSTDAHDARVPVGNGEIPEHMRPLDAAQDQARALGIALPNVTHDAWAHDAQDYAQDRALSDLQVQTSSSSDPLLVGKHQNRHEEEHANGLTSEPLTNRDHTPWDEAAEELEQILPEGLDRRGRSCDAFLRLAKDWVTDPDPNRRPLRALQKTHAEVRRAS